MSRQLKRFQPKGSKYKRKTADKHGQEIVKPFLKSDYDEMQRICKSMQESCASGTDAYYRHARDSILMHLGVNCGARITTLIELTWRDIMGGMLTITEHKTGKRTQWQLNDKVFDPIQRYVKEFGILENQYLFTPDRRTDFPINRATAWRRIKIYAKKAKIQYPVGCHSLRKSYARWDWDENRDLLRASSLLGHEDPLTTMTYICLEKGDVQEARNQIDNTSKWL
jgi:integrase